MASSDTAFLSVTLSTGSNFGYVLDTLRAVDAAAIGTVPEPGSLALVSLALMGFGAAARKRRP